MAVGSFEWTDLSLIDGITMGTAQAGVKYPNRDDVALFEICDGASVAGVFTRNAFCAEPVKMCRQHLAQATPRYLLINSGNANACTGEAGYRAAEKTCTELAKLAGVKLQQVLPFSTGVIGEVLPADKIVAALPAALTDLKQDAWLSAAKAIMTTDTRPKGISRSIKLGGNTVNVSGIAKGAGMIKPNMGTMLGYVATDAAVDQNVLEQITEIAANKSFNRITVDGDESTNDSLIVMATAKADVAKITSLTSAEGQALLACIIDVCSALAIEMVRDAEGATKCVQVDVEQGATANESLSVAYAVCHSPLIKTAMFASDPNWGRIVAAIGYAGIDNLDARLVKVWLDDVLIVENGGRASSYTEDAGQEVFNKAEFTIRISLGRGDSSESLWTSDLSHDYVKINAEYRT